MVRPRSENEVGRLITRPLEEQPVSPAPLPAPVEVISGGMLCRLRVWNDQEWAQLPEKQRPREFAKVPGLGWIGAVPIAGLN